MFDNVFIKFSGTPDEFDDKDASLCKSILHSKEVNDC